MTLKALTTTQIAPSSPSNTITAVPSQSANQQPDTLETALSVLITYDTINQMPVIPAPSQLLVIVPDFAGTITWKIDPGAAVKMQFVPGVMFGNSLPPTTTSASPFTPPASWPTEVKIPWFNLNTGESPQLFNYTITIVTEDGRIFSVDPTVENDPHP